MRCKFDFLNFQQNIPKVTKVPVEVIDSCFQIIVCILLYRECLYKNTKEIQKLLVSGKAKVSKAGRV